MEIAKFNSEGSLAEGIDGVIAKIDTQKQISPSPGFIVVTEVPDETVEAFTSDFKKQGFYVSDKVTSGKIAIVWDTNALEGFKKSGYRFE